MVDTFSSGKPDRARRRWLIATSALGVGGGAVASAPLFASMAKPAQAQADASTVSVDLTSLAPGQVTTVGWQGRPVWVLNRTPAMLADVAAATPLCADPDTARPYSMPLPDYCRNPVRARAEHPNIVVLVGLCTHLGCTPVPRFSAGPQAQLPEDWPGGWLCPCHGSTFDLAGRVFKDMPATRNLDIPRYMFTSSGQLLIGRDEHGEA